MVNSGSSPLLTVRGTTNQKRQRVHPMKSVSHNYTHAGTGVEVWYNFVRNNPGKLSKEDRAKQDKAVFLALDNLEEGKVVSWHNMER